MRKTVQDHDEEIRKSKVEGKSLRKIASALGISRMTVARRLKALGQRDGLVTANGADVTETEGYHTPEKSHPDRVPEISRHTLKPMSHKRTPSSFIE